MDPQKARSIVLHVYMSLNSYPWMKGFCHGGVPPQTARCKVQDGITFTRKFDRYLTLHVGGDVGVPPQGGVQESFHPGVKIPALWSPLGPCGQGPYGPGPHGLGPGPYGPGPSGPPGTSWAGSLKAPWALMCRALVGWALMLPPGQLFNRSAHFAGPG